MSSLGNIVGETFPLFYLETIGFLINNINLRNNIPLNAGSEKSNGV